jgi:hypothetical protein
VSPSLQVFNEVGQSEWSKPVAFSTSASVPDPPHGLVAVESTTDSIAVHWQARMLWRNFNMLCLQRSSPQMHLRSRTLC